jgi:hypothetical protein
MTYILRVHDDEGKIALGGTRKGESVEKITDYPYETLGEAIARYEKIVDWGFAGWQRVVSIIDPAGEVIVSKTHETPRGVPIS